MPDIIKKLVIFLVLAMLLAPAGLSFAGPGWREWLQEETLAPIAEKSVRLAREGGLDALTSFIRDGLNIARMDALPESDMKPLLASMWVFSVNAAMLQNIDPFPNKAYEKIFNEGLEMAGTKLGITGDENIKKCISLTIRVIRRAQNANLGKGF